MKPLFTSFEEAYRESVGAHSALPFVSVISLRGERVAKTFAEFDLDVAKVMTYLKERTRGRQQIVTCAGNQYEHLATIVAAWRSGIAWCPINPAETPARIDEKVRKLGGESTLLYLTEMRAALTQPPSTESAKIFGGEHLSTLIFTSGSTGYAKIVEQRENAILANAADLIAAHGLKPGVTLATPLPVFHVNALHFSFLTALLSGAKLVLLENFVVPQIWKAIRDEGVHIVSAVPQMFKHMCTSPEADFYDLSSWKYCVSAAAPLSKKTATDFHTRFKRKIIQGYGLSEGVNFSCLMPPDIADDEYESLFLQAPVPSIGKALPCNEVLVLSEKGERLKENEEGELALRGINVMRGYRGESENNVVDGVFRTGDLGFYKLSKTGEKFFYISGRLKDIVKRGGLTVSLREIDDVMGEFIQADSIAVAFDNNHTGEEIGLVLSLPAATKTPEGLAVLQKQLSEFLNAKLPAHMRPYVAIAVDQPLRSPSGKPARWTFKPLFNPFQDKTIGRSLIVL